MQVATVTYPAYQINCHDLQLSGQQFTTLAAARHALEAMYPNNPYAWGEIIPVGEPVYGTADIADMPPTPAEEEYIAACVAALGIRFND